MPPPPAGMPPPAFFFGSSATGQGLSVMFQMMNEARIMVGLGAAMLGFPPS
jgi:alkylation response protein AidB-like acyl-CoA dehydrogenase